MVRALAWSALYWIAAAIPFAFFRWAIGIGAAPLGLAALVGVGPATAIVTWLYLRRVDAPSRRVTSLAFASALVLLHPPADYAFLSRFAPEILWNHLLGWKGALFYAMLAAAPLLTARFGKKGR